MPKTKRRYDWIPDLPDPRDRPFAFSKIAARAAAKLPADADLRPGCSAIEDQGRIGSCTANALAGALEFLEFKDGARFADFSRLFIYYNERDLRGTTEQDSGAMLRDGIKVLNKLGSCTERTWPYEPGRVFRKPTPKAYREALSHQILQYHRLASLDEMRGCLAAGFPFVFGFSVFSGMESPEVARTGALEMPKPGEKLLGGHAVMAAGYDDASRRLVVRNSWGEGWGQKGYFTMPYDYITTRGLSDDFWVISKIEE